MGNQYYPKLDWEDYATTLEKLRAIYNILNNISFNMELGKVPQNKEELEESITSTKNKLLTPLSIAFVKMAEKGELDEITMKENAKMFLHWNENVQFSVNALRIREIDNEIKLFKSIQAHTSQPGWEPENTPALWKEIGIAENGILEWSQPISSSDVYMSGDEVMFEGVHYRSTIDNNVWSPTSYPQGWEVV